MTTSFPRSLLVSIILAIASVGPCHAMISFGYLSPAQAKESGLKIRYRAAGPNDVWVEVAFPNDGKWAHFREPNRLNYIELSLDNNDGKLGLRTALRENRSTSGRVAVSFTVERAQLHRVGIWITRRDLDVADVVRMKDYIPLGTIGKDFKIVPSKEEQTAK